MSRTVTNPAIDDRDVEQILEERLGELLRLPYFADHDRESCARFVASCRILARGELLPAYRALDADPPRLVAGRVIVHPKLHGLFAKLVGLDLIAAPRPREVGGAQLPMTVFALGTAYLMAANLSAYGYLGLTQGAAHLIEAFGDAALRETYMTRMYRGEWTGTMALTEPQAGSSLADVATVAEPAGDHYLLRGSKIFISGGDHDLAPNIVHMTLARIAGAPAGMKGVSLFCVPAKRVEGGALVDNDVAVTGVIHKIGWRGLPSIALAYGERGECRGWLVGEPHQGIRYMFQMMNEARLMVGLNGVATASVAYHESLAYARVRVQGRGLTIDKHPDVRRMLLRQKAIVDGGLAFLARVAAYGDLAAHGGDARAQVLLDLLTPVAKSFPAERGFEANALALQIHGGYGYSSEFPLEAWLRDQKLNTIHEGTTGIQAMDLLGRRVSRDGMVALGEEIAKTCARARAAAVDAAWIAEVERAVGVIGGATGAIARKPPGEALRHATDYLDMFGTVAIAWTWLELAAIACEALAGPLPRGTRDAGYFKAKLAAAQYWIRTELPRIDHLAKLCVDNEDSYAALDPDWL